MFVMHSASACPRSIARPRMHRTFKSGLGFSLSAGLLCCFVLVCLCACQHAVAAHGEEEPSLPPTTTTTTVATDLAEVTSAPLPTEKEPSATSDILEGEGESKAPFYEEKNLFLDESNLPTSGKPSPTEAAQDAADLPKRDGEENGAVKDTVSETIEEPREESVADGIESTSNAPLEAEVGGDAGDHWDDESPTDLAGADGAGTDETMDRVDEGAARATQSSPAATPAAEDSAASSFTTDDKREPPQTTRDESGEHVPLSREEEENVVAESHVAASREGQNREQIEPQNKDALRSSHDESEGLAAQEPSPAEEVQEPATAAAADRSFSSNKDAVDERVEDYKGALADAVPPSSTTAPTLAPASSEGLYVDTDAAAAVKSAASSADVPLKHEQSGVFEAEESHTLTQGSEAEAAVTFPVHPAPAAAPETAAPITPEVVDASATDATATRHVEVSGEETAEAAWDDDAQQATAVGEETNGRDGVPLVRDQDDQASTSDFTVSGDGDRKTEETVNEDNIYYATDVPTAAPTHTTTTFPTSLSSEHHRVAPPPSRLALSHLYYHALEALYVKENITLFVQRARDAAPYGHARLNWLLGVLHAYGLGVPRSERDALMYYTFAAMEAVPEAHMALGYRYRNGIGVRASCESALAHYREAADAVAMTYDGSAADLDGQTVMDQTGVPTILRGSGGRNGALSLFTYRDNVANSDKANKAQRDLMTLIYQADRNDPQALLALGYMHLKGTTQIRRDVWKAVHYLERAAHREVAEAYGALGNLYTAGDLSATPPLPRNLTRALDYYTEGRYRRDAVSYNGIGFLYAIGFLPNITVAATEEPADSSTAEEEKATGTAPDFRAAAAFFRKSGTPEATYNLAVLHLYGRGAPADRQMAQRLFWNAAQGGSVLARWQLAHMLDESLDKNPGECVKALELYKETASFGSWRRGSGTGSSSSGGGVLASLMEQYGADDFSDEEVIDGEEEEEDTSPLFEAPRADDGAAAEGKIEGATAENTFYHGGDAAAGAPSAPRTAAHYQRQLRRIVARLQSVEKGLRLSDSEDGPAMVSLASLVELLGLAETGDAASTWVAAQFVDSYLDVTDTSSSDGGVAHADGAVQLLWPSSTRTPGTPPFMPAEEARTELLCYLLQRTVLHPRQKASAHGAAYRRLGDVFYYGESAERGVDMARALEYYRLAADLYHDPQALFNVGFMYQTGLHAAPRATRVRTGSTVTEEEEEVWQVHANPPYYLTGSPALLLTAHAVGHAWVASNSSATASAVDLYSAWKYYTESLRREGRGWLAVNVALVTLNVQWSLRHFMSAVLRWDANSVGRGRTFSLTELGEAMREHKLDAFFAAHAPGGGGRRDGAEAGEAAAGADPARELMQNVLSLFRMETHFVWRVLCNMAVELRNWYMLLEQFILIGACLVFGVALLVRHHAT